MSKGKLWVVVCLTAVVTITSSYAAAPPPGADAVVARLYKDFAWEAKSNDTEKTGLIDQPKSVLSSYFDETMTRLILEDRACSARTNEICRLDFPPIWDSQDPAAAGLKVSATKDPSIVQVTFRNPVGGEVTTLSYEMTKTAAGWRIHDIKYKSHQSLLAILRMKI